MRTPSVVDLPAPESQNPRGARETGGTRLIAMKLSVLAHLQPDDDVDEDDEDELDDDNRDDEDDDEDDEDLDDDEPETWQV